MRRHARKSSGTCAATRGNAWARNGGNDGNGQGKAGGRGDSLAVGKSLSEASRAAKSRTDPKRVFFTQLRSAKRKSQKWGQLFVWIAAQRGLRGGFMELPNSEAVYLRFLGKLLWSATHDLPRAPLLLVPSERSGDVAQVQHAGIPDLLRHFRRLRRPRFIVCVTFQRLFRVFFLLPLTSSFSAPLGDPTWDEGWENRLCLI